MLSKRIRNGRSTPIGRSQGANAKVSPSDAAVAANEVHKSKVKAWS